MTLNPNSTVPRLRNEVKAENTSVRNNPSMDPNLARSLRAPEIDSLVELLQTAFPDNQQIKTGVLPLLSNKKAYVKTLLDM